MLRGRSETSTVYRHRNAAHLGIFAAQIHIVAGCAFNMNWPTVKVLSLFEWAYLSTLS